MIHTGAPAGKSAHCNACGIAYDGRRPGIGLRPPANGAQRLSEVRPKEMATIRPARTSDAAAICSLVNYHAEQGKMLHRSMESVYDSLREFQVAEDDGGQVVACVAVDVFWDDLAEIKSLAVAPEQMGKGLGSQLVRAAVADARELGTRRLFALTYEQDFFARHGFKVIERQTLPEKVWRECVACPKADACDEIAMLLVLEDVGQTQPDG
jgi:amino-acid N-acetyltransferase